MTLSLVLDPDVGLHQYMCNACNGMSNMSPLQNLNFDWIVCEGEESCGRIFHRECVPDGPPTGIPLPRQEKPQQLTGNIWNWKCQQCRHKVLDTEGHINQCYKCSKEFANEPSVAVGKKLPLPKSLWSGYFSICPECKPSCINCTKELSHTRSLESRFCSPCLINLNQGHACPGCLRSYSDNSENEEDEDMIQCDRCNVWTHFLCTGLTKKEYSSFGKESAAYFCKNCTKNPVDPTGLKLTCCVCNVKDCRTLIPVEAKDEKVSSLTRWCHLACRPLIQCQSSVQKAPILQRYLLRSGHDSKLITNSGVCLALFKSAWYVFHRRKNGTEIIRCKLWATYSLSLNIADGKRVFAYEVLLPPNIELSSTFPALQAESLPALAESVQATLFKRFHYRHSDVEEIKKFILTANFDRAPFKVATENPKSPKNFIRPIAPKSSSGSQRDNSKVVASLKETIQGYLGMAINVLGRTTLPKPMEPDTKPNPNFAVNSKRAYTRRIQIEKDEKDGVKLSHDVPASVEVVVPLEIEATSVKGKRNCTKKATATEQKAAIVQVPCPSTPIVDDLSCARHRGYDRVAAFLARKAAIMAANTPQGDENEDPAEKVIGKNTFNVSAVPVRLPQKEKDKEKGIGSLAYLPLGMAYRLLATISKKDLIVARSAIAGYGLFAGRRYVPNELVIEYCGEIIGHALGDRREMTVYGPKTKFHDSCYMFGLDDARIIDATLKGNAARFINHCCQPNCRTKNFSIDGVSRILVIAQKEIAEGEELSYDYQFAYEKEAKDGDDDMSDGKQVKRSSTRLPCYCGATKCRGWMN